MGKSGLFLGLFVAISLAFTVSCVSREVPVTETYYETEYKTEFKTEIYTTEEDIVVKTVEGVEALSTVVQWGNYYGYNVSTLNHTESHAQINFPKYSDYKGIIQVSNLTDACNDKNLKSPGTLFGKDPPTNNTSLYWYPPEGCQVCHPVVTIDGRLSQTWIDDFNTLMGIQERILHLLSIDKGTTDRTVAFSTEDIEEFAVIIRTEPKISPLSVKVIWSDDIVERRTVTKERQVPYQVPMQVEKQRVVMQVKKIPIWELWKAEP